MNFVLSSSWVSSSRRYLIPEGLFSRVVRVSLTSSHDIDLTRSVYPRLHAFRNELQSNTQARLEKQLGKELTTLVLTNPKNASQQRGR